MTFYLVHPRGIVVRRHGDELSPTTMEDASKLGVTLGEDVGDGERAAVFADEPPAPYEVAGLRELFPVLGERRWFAAGRAVQIAEWASTHRFCGRCATPTVRVEGERCMKCPSCLLTAYPRIAPAVIVLVTRGDEALLARGARFPRPFYSTLAGFVEVGESLEETVAREIREEVGVEVTDVRYFGSQPWPFPHSLMVGFNAAWAGGDVRVDPTEIIDAQWFRRDTLPIIPPKPSIARRLIDSWLEGDPRS
jgi:NAD+ diphosphatase